MHLHMSMLQFAVLLKLPIKVDLPNCGGKRQEENILESKLFLFNSIEFIYLFIALWVYF